MADYPKYPASVITPDGIAFEGEVQRMIVTGVGGQIGFYARHTPLVADLKVGHVKAELSEGETRTWATGEGFVQVHDSVATAVVEDAVDVSEIVPSEVELWLTPARSELAEHEARSHAMPDRAEIEGAADPNAVFRRELSALTRRVAWGEHLLAMHARSTGAAATH